MGVNLLPGLCVSADGGAWGGWAGSSLGGTCPALCVLWGGGSPRAGFWFTPLSFSLVFLKIYLFI